jgi:hypothetical protein
MTFLKSSLAKGALVAALACGTLTATSASADVVCNRAGECWHTGDQYNYPVGVGIRFHSDDWGRRHHRDYHWRRDRDERGYYRDGLWIRF